jgi:DNA-directed RNA polymerase subunit alpha
LVAITETLTEQWRICNPAFSARVRHHHRQCLRRVLLSSIEGAAITAVRIERGTVQPDPGVVEDATDIILNKQIPSKSWRQCQDRSSEVDRHGDAQRTD